MRPGSAVVYVSGYTDDAIGQHGLLDAGTHVLSKPFTSQQLLLNCREVLSSGDQASTTPRSGLRPRVVLTGTTDEVVGRYGAIAEGTVFIQEPFGPSCPRSAGSSTRPAECPAIMANCRVRLAGKRIEQKIR